MQLKSYAKNNLVLGLGEKMSGGKNEHFYIINEIDWHDNVTVEELNENKILIECNVSGVPLDEKNLCWKAVELMQKELGEQRGVKIVLEKQIPAAGGLGGGSSNAATVIKALNKLWGLGLSEQKLIELVNPVLGTDASFFIKGGICYQSKFGFPVERIKTSLQLNFVFAVPKVVVPENKTRKAFQYLDLKKASQKPPVKECIKALEENDFYGIAKNLYNVFLFSLLPEFSKCFNLINEMKELGCENAIVCGSGPTVFGLTESESKAKEIAKQLEKDNERVFTAKSRVVE
ncbi:MAG: 4-(cytidine 5'-diphospho)-2-C-methyl-D-erythritol kinase [archaeon]